MQNFYDNIIVVHLQVLCFLNKSNSSFFLMLDLNFDFWNPYWEPLIVWRIMVYIFLEYFYIRSSYKSYFSYSYASFGRKFKQRDLTIFIFCKTNFSSSSWLQSSWIFYHPSVNRQNATALFKKRIFAYRIWCANHLTIFNILVLQLFAISFFKVQKCMHFIIFKWKGGSFLLLFLAQLVFTWPIFDLEFPISSLLQHFIIFVAPNVCINFKSKPNLRAAV